MHKFSIRPENLTTVLAKPGHPARQQWRRIFFFMAAGLVVLLLFGTSAIPARAQLGATVGLPGSSSNTPSNTSQINTQPGPGANINISIPPVPSLNQNSAGTNNTTGNPNITSSSNNNQAPPPAASDDTPPPSSLKYEDLKALENPSPSPDTSKSKNQPNQALKIPTTPRENNLPSSNTNRDMTLNLASPKETSPAVKAVATVFPPPLLNVWAPITPSFAYLPDSFSPQTTKAMMSMAGVLIAFGALLLGRNLLRSQTKARLGLSSVSRIKTSFS